MAANTEGWIGAGDGHGIVKGSAGGHQRSGAKCPSLMKLHNGAINARGKAEVVRVDDETGSHVSLIADGREKMVGSEGLEPPTSCL